MNRRAVFGVFFVAFAAPAVAQAAEAQSVTVEVIIKSVEPTAHAITVAYKTTTGEKPITLDVSRKAVITIKGQEATLDALTPGDKATVEYNKELAIVTKIDAAGDVANDWRFTDLDGKGTADPETACIITKDGTLICRSQAAKAGGWYLITNRQFPAMLFTVEFRYPKADRMAGAIVVGTPGPVGGKGMPFGFEVKLAPGTCGQIELPRRDFRVELPLGQIRDGRRVTRTRQKDPVVGQWNKLEIECNSHNNVVVKLNGEVVNAVGNAENVSGKIVLWPMGSEIHFRNPTVTIDGKEQKLEFSIAKAK